MPSASASRSTSAAASCSRYCAPPSCAACCSSCSFVDALAQRLQAALDAQALLVGGAQLGAQVVVVAARRGQRLFALQLQRQRGLQPGLCGGVVQAGEFLLRAARRLLRWPPPAVARCRCRAAVRRGARQQAARLERGFLCLALQRALLFARAGQRALGGDAPHRPARLCRSCASASCRSSSSKRASAVARALLQLFELRVDFGQLAIELAAPCVRWPRPAGSGAAVPPAAGAPASGLRRLRGARRPGAATLRCTPPRRARWRCAIRRRSGFARAAGVRGSRSPAAAPACRPARNRARRSSPHAATPHGPSRDMMTSPCVSWPRAASASSRLARGVDAFEPVVQQRLQASVVQPQQVRQARQCLGACWRSRRQSARRRPAAPAARRRRRHARFPVGRLPARSGARAARLPARFPSRARCARASTGLAGRPAHVWPARASACLRSAPCPATRAALPGARQFGLTRRISLRAACACVRRCSSSVVHLLGQLVQARFGIRPALHRAAALLRFSSARRCASGAARPLALAAQALAALAQLARLLVQAAALGRQHLDLLLHLRHCAALLAAALPAPRAARPPGPAACRDCSSACAACSTSPALRRPASASAMSRSSACRCRPAAAPTVRPAPSDRAGATRHVRGPRPHNGCALPAG